MSNDLSLEEVYVFHLEKAYKQFKKYKNDQFQKAGIDLTSDQWILIKRISEMEGISQKDLALSIYKEPASVTRILDILQKRGWIERRNIENDRRVYGLYLTQEGKLLVEKILPLARQIRAKGIEGISEEDSKKLILMLHKIFENFR